jgi:hypothetical protein
MALAVIAVTACGGFNYGGELTQGIEGRYVITGPGMIQDCLGLTTRAEREACEASNEPWTRPMAAAELEVWDTENRLVTMVVTDSEGGFRVELAAGDYLLCDAGCDGPITVTSGKFTVYEVALAVP